MIVTSHPVLALALLSIGAGGAWQEDRTFAYRLEEVTTARISGVPDMNTMDVEAADLDGDGDLDLVTAQEFRLNVALRNDGGRFSPWNIFAPLPAQALAAGPPQLRFPGAGHDSEDVSIADFNGDGALDIVIVSEDDVKFGRTNVHELYLGGAGGFTRADGVLLDTEANAVAHADVDGDGDPDLLIVGAGQDRLLINDGRAGFADETAARLPREAATGQDAEFADLDGDGDLDLVLGLEGGHSLWLNDGAGRFSDATDRLPEAGNVEARKVAPVDVDGDGDLDLYFSHVGWQGRAPQDRLFLNDGRGGFTDVTSERLPRETGTTLDARFADLDGDGDLDMVRADIGPVTIWANDGQGRFTDVTDQVLTGNIAGPNVAIEIQDFDGDGVLDIYVGQLKGPQGGPEIRDRLLLGRRSAPEA
ncbi:MAG: FG-GAP repeat domain-containing protein [Brevundimonas sp.]